MTIFFADTSAIIKRYVPESGSDWVGSWAKLPSTDAVIISEITTVETVAFFTRRQREKNLSSDDLAMLRNDFLLHVEREYLVISVDSVVFIRARNLVHRYPLRAIDAVQLACALDVMRALNLSLTFVSADRMLLAAAALEGLATDNPENHI